MQNGKGKLLLYLDALKTENDNSVTLPVSVEELSRYFGVARPSLSQVISDLQNEGLIIKTGRIIRFLRTNWPWAPPLYRPQPSVS